MIGKLGYSTLAECWTMGKPLGRVPSAHFREAPVLDGWAAKNLPGLSIDHDEFLSGAWLTRTDELLAIEGGENQSGGADAAAEILERIAGF